MNSGYTSCACPDCMDVTVSSDMAEPEMCFECEEAGCEADESACDPDIDYNDEEHGNVGC